MSEVKAKLFEYTAIHLSLDERRDASKMIETLNIYANEGWRYIETVGEEIILERERA